MRVATQLGVCSSYRVAYVYDSPRRVLPFGGGVESPGSRVVAVAGIARPQRFFESLKTLGWDVVRELRFRDHHRFSSADMSRIAAVARDSSADLILTTEKDAVRMQDLPIDGPTLAYLPMRVAIEPSQFISWLRSRIAEWSPA